MCDLCRLLEKLEGEIQNQNPMEVRASTDIQTVIDSEHFPKTFVEVYKDFALITYPDILDDFVKRTGMHPIFVSCAMYLAAGGSLDIPSLEAACDAQKVKQMRSALAKAMCAVEGDAMPPISN